HPPPQPRHLPFLPDRGSGARGVRRGADVPGAADGGGRLLAGRQLRPALGAARAGRRPAAGAGGRGVPGDRPGPHHAADGKRAVAVHALFPAQVARLAAAQARPVPRAPRHRRRHPAPGHARAHRLAGAAAYRPGLAGRLLRRLFHRRRAPARAAGAGARADGGRRSGDPGRRIPRAGAAWHRRSGHPALGRPLRLPRRPAGQRLCRALDGGAAGGGLNRARRYNGGPFSGGPRGRIPMQEQILAALRRGDADEALALARTLLEAEPGASRSHRLLAMVLQVRGERDAALAAVETALGIDPEDADAHFQRGVILGGARDMATAQAALNEAIRLDPNQFGAYILQAQFALGRGDLDEATRLATLANRLQPGHPWLGAVQGMAALGRGQADEALALLSQAAGQAPDDPQVLLPLALAYNAKGHHAFAEQALRKLVDGHGGALPWRLLLAETLARQGRAAEGLEALAPVLVDVETVAPPVLRLAGELELAAGRPGEALPWLRRALATMPHDARALAAAMAAWQRLGDRGEARAALEELLAATPQSSALWRARLALEPDDATRAREVAARWGEAMPEAPEALEARMGVALQAGDEDAAL